jgi:tRNA(His) 5'-end guanylyltransferase
LIYDGKIQKIASITAGKATSTFNSLMLRMLSTLKYSQEEIADKIANDNFPEINAFFDSRVFIIPDITEVYNYFTWRQQDCTRNSISMAASAYFSHKELDNMSSDKKQEMLFSKKGVNWNDYKIKYKRGLVVKRHVITQMSPLNEEITRSKWIPDYITPIFSQDKEYLQN